MRSSRGVAWNRAVLLTLSLLQLAKRNAVVNYGVSNYSFPDGFIFGVSTSAFQIEGAWNEGGLISITLDAFWAEPQDPDNPGDVKAADDYLQMTSLAIYSHPIYSDFGDYPRFVRERIKNMSRQQGHSRSRLLYFTDEEIKSLQGSSDFFGINHYTTYLMTPSSMEPHWQIPSLDHDTGVRMELNPNWPRPAVVFLAMRWISVYPPGMRKLINWIQDSYKMIKKIPIIITENGLIDMGQTEDYERVSYYNDYLYQVLLAIHEDGCNVKGYFAWSLFDNFEWNHGYKSWLIQS